jgi:hypothetical protein
MYVAVVARSSSRSRINWRQDLFQGLRNRLFVGAQVDLVALVIFSLSFYKLSFLFFADTFYALEEKGPKATKTTSAGNQAPD